MWIVYTFFLLFRPVVVTAVLYTQRQVGAGDNDTSTDQEVESPDNVRVDTPSDLEIASGSGLGLVRISEGSLYTEETPTPYESTVLA